MIASHNSYTYLDATNSFVNSLTEFWRCQNESITNQYKKGVRYFDVRVKREVKDGKNTWRCCHGMAEVSKVFTTLKSICTYFTSTLKGSYIRIVLEKGDEEDVKAFKEEVTPLCGRYECLEWVVIKQPWTTLWQKKNSHRIVLDNSYEKWGVWDVIKNIFTSPIKNHAQETNPVITQEMIDSEDVYFLDYATNNF